MRNIAVIGGSDDGLTVWLNGHRIHDRGEFIPLFDGSSRFDVELNPGRNYMLVKVTQALGVWEALLWMEHDPDLRISISIDGAGVPLPPAKGERWLTLNSGMQGAHVTDLRTWNGALYAGTEGHGVFKYIDGENRWDATGDELTGRYVISLETIGDFLYVSTEDAGVFRLNTDGGLWEGCSTGITDTHITAFGGTRNSLYAATWSDGFFRSRDSGNTWQPMPSTVHAVPEQLR